MAIQPSVDLSPVCRFRQSIFLLRDLAKFVLKPQLVLVELRYQNENSRDYAYLENQRIGSAPGRPECRPQP
jgi:hypothetical protein